MEASRMGDLRIDVALSLQSGLAFVIYWACRLLAPPTPTRFCWVIAASRSFKNRSIFVCVFVSILIAWIAVRDHQLILSFVTLDLKFFKRIWDLFSIKMDCSYVCPIVHKPINGNPVELDKTSDDICKNWCLCRRNGFPKKKQSPCWHHGFSSPPESDDFLMF